MGEQKTEIIGNNQDIHFQELKREQQQERSREASRNWKRNNIEHVLEYKKEWLKRNPEKAREYNRKQYLRRKALKAFQVLSGDQKDGENL